MLIEERRRCCLLDAVNVKRPRSVEERLALDQEAKRGFARHVGRLLAIDSSKLGQPGACKR